MLIDNICILVNCIKLNKRVLAGLGAYLHEYRLRIKYNNETIGSSNWVGIC